ncbi:MAG: (2,3-dihydroxybenzoyl)adenylate synthase [Candidatus Dormibacteria bacterium]
MTLAGVTPFPAEFAARYRQLGYWEDRPLGDVFLECFASHGDRTAVVDGDERWTFAELGSGSERLAMNLRDLGIGPLTPVVMHLPNVIDFILLYFALERLGAIPLMALPGHREHEIGHYVEFVEAAAYAIPPRYGAFDCLDLGRRMMAPGRPLRQVLVAGDAPHEPGFVGIRELLARTPHSTARDLDRLAINPDDPCVFQLSGGTTGVPKIIPRSHNDYVYNSRLIAAVNDIRVDDSLLVAAPIGHNFPLASPGLQGFFLHGAAVVLSPTARAADVLWRIEQERVTHLEIVPAMVLAWLNDDLIGTHDLSSVRVINSGGQKFQPETKRRTEAAFPKALVQEVFGMAEGLLMITRLDDSERVRYETAGRPICPDDEVKLVDDDGLEVAPGAIGELLCRGPYTLRGYYRAPEANRRAFTADGFYCSGDLLRQHPSGNYVVEGRKKDLVNRGGEKISAEEVEDMLLTHPAVANVACVPMPDPVLGERMCAFVQPRGPKAPTLNQLTALLSELGLARFKHPERLEVVARLPLSPFGKVQKSVLAKRAAELAETPSEGDQE